MPLQSTLAKSVGKLVNFYRNSDSSLRGTVQNTRINFFDVRITPNLSGYDNDPDNAGSTIWNLGTMGALIIDGSNNGTSYTITNLSTRMKHIQMWGQGGQPGGKGGYSYGDFNLVKDQAYALSLNQGGGVKSNTPNTAQGNGGGYGGLFTGSVDRANSVIISGGGGGRGGIFDYAAGGDGGGSTGSAGAAGGGPGGGSGGGQSCPTDRYLDGQDGSGGGGGSNYSGGGAGGAGYCGGNSGGGGSDPGGGTVPSSAGGGGSGYILQPLTPNGVTTTYPAGSSDPNRGSAGDGPARFVMKLST